MVRPTWVLAATLLVACGGSSNGDLTSGSPSRPDASAGTSNGGTSNGGTSNGGSAGSAGGGAPTGGSGGVATGGSSAGGGSGTGATGGSGTAGAGGSGGAPGAGIVKCGLQTCTTSSQSCCFGDNVTPYCYPKNAFMGCKCTGLLCETAVVNCDGPEDCGTGQVCCATKGITGTHFDHLSCAKTCQGGITTTAAVVCHLNSSGTCPSGQSCVSDPRLPGSYGLCRP